MDVATSIFAGVVACVLFLSSVSRFHHHDEYGAIHYSFVCIHDDACDHCGENAVDGRSHDRIPGDGDEDNCALRLDSFCFDKWHHNSKLLYLIKDFSEGNPEWINISEQWVIEYAPCAIHIVYAQSDHIINDMDLPVLTRRGPPYSAWNRQIV